MAADEAASHNAISQGSHTGRDDTSVSGPAVCVPSGGANPLASWSRARYRRGSRRASVVPCVENDRRVEETMPTRIPAAQGLYDPRFEHDACGVSFVVDIKGRARHEIVRMGIGALCNLDHRGASGAEPNTGDGAGVLIQMPDRFLRSVVPFRRVKV